MDIRQSFYELLLIIFLLCIDSGLSFLTDEDYFDEPSFNRCPWIRNKLKNGRVRYRYKGRVAKFLCDSGFELAGKRSSTCVRGQWSNPVPVCVARGCPRVPTISNGRITEMYRGALLVYDCNPGYMLDGNPTIHCDGRRWNTSPPSCAIATEKPETYCDFENPDLCGWSQDPNHDFDWQRNQFSTPSGHVGTGPEFDHTFGENKGGFYLYIEASSPRKLNDTARLFSPVYPSDLSGGCFIFWYHMYGATTGGLRVYLKPESHVFDELTPMWQKYGDLGNQWLKGHMIVPVLHENFQIVIEGVRGESYVGDSAIDDVRLTTNLCDSDDNSTDISETVDQYSCRGRCQESGSESSCGCNVNCVDEPNFCCRDYYTICTIGNSTSTPNTDEPPREDYTTTSTVTSQSTRYTTVEHTEEELTTPTELQTEKTESTNATSVVSSSTLSSRPTSLNPDTSTKEESGHNVSENISIMKQTTISTVSVSSKILTTEISKTSTTAIDTTQHTSSATLPSTSTTSTTVPTTSLKTTVISTTPPTTSTTLPTTTLKTQDLTTSKTQQTTLDTTSTTISTLPSFSEIPTQTVRIPQFNSNSSNSTASITSTSSSTELTTDSTSAATVLSTEQATLLTTTLSPTRKTYNLRPRNRTVSTTPYTSPSITEEPISPTYTRLKESTSSSYLKSTTQHLTTWHKYPITFTTKQQRTSSLIVTTSKPFLLETTKNNVASETTFRNTPLTTRVFNRFTKPTKSSITKTEDFYESKSETTSSNSSMPIVVSVIIIILICLIAGTVYYFIKKSSKRQSKLSDDSEMRFLQENDYMDYSDPSALDRILVK